MLYFSPLMLRAFFMPKCFLKLFRKNEVKVYYNKLKKDNEL